MSRVRLKDSPSRSLAHRSLTARLMFDTIHTESARLSASSTTAPRAESESCVPGASMSTAPDRRTAHGPDARTLRTSGQHAPSATTSLESMNRSRLRRNALGFDAVTSRVVPRKRVAVRHRRSLARSSGTEGDLRVFLPVAGSIASYVECVYDSP